MNEILEHGYIFKKTGINKKEKVEYYMKEIHSEQIYEILELQKHVYNNIEDKSLYQKRSYDEFLKYLKDGGIFLGVFVNRELVAVRITDVPGLKEHNYGYLLNYSKEKLLKSIHFKIMLVKKEYRGNNLQLRTLLLVEKIFLQRGFSYGLCRISPDNYFSLKNALEFGLEIKSIEEFNANQVYTRFLLSKDLETLQSITFKPVKYVSNKDIKKQKKLLNDGYIGFKAKNFNAIDNFTIVYGKPI